MRKPLALLKVAALGAMGALAACATVGETASATVALPEFREPSIAMFDDSGQAVFKSERGYALAIAGNEQGQVFEAANRMVRITPEGRAGLWLRCADLQPGIEHCNGVAAEPANLVRSLPACPGDPRCPRRNPDKK